MAISCSACGTTIAEHWQTCITCRAPVPSRPPVDPLPGYQAVRCSHCLRIFHAPQGRAIISCTDCGAYVPAPHQRP